MDGEPSATAIAGYLFRGDLGIFTEDGFNDLTLLLYVPLRIG